MIVKEYFTLFWRNGDRSVIYGNDIQDAYTKAGYGGGSIRALDWYANGITESHYWDKKRKQWLPYEPIIIHIADFVKMSVEEISSLFDKYRQIHVEKENKDRLEMCLLIGHFSIGWRRTIQIYDAEYVHGSYDQEDGHDSYTFHFMVSGTEYVNPDNFTLASEIFLKRAVAYMEKDYSYVSKRDGSLENNSTGYK